MPPIINSQEYVNEIYSLVKKNSTNRKINASSFNLTAKSIDRSTDSKASTDSLSIISDLENISINEKILEINENNFIEHLTSSTKPSTSFNDSNRKDVKIRNDNLTTTASSEQQQTLKSTTVNKVDSKANLDESQAYKQDKIKNENVDSVKRELDAIFGKAGKSAKNRLFEDDSDDELFQSLSHQSLSKNQQKSTKDLFKSESEESIVFNVNKSSKKDLFESNIKSTSKSNDKSTEKSSNKPTIQTDIKQTAKLTAKSDIKTKNESVHQTNQLPSNKKNVLDKLFDSDSEEDELFSARLTKSKEKRSDRLEDKKTINETKQININKESELSKDSKEEDNIAKIKTDKEEESESAKETSSSKESLIEDKMSNKKDLFKNQLEDLFAKKRNPSHGFIKVTREKEDSLNEDNEKNKENLGSLTSITSMTSKSSSTSSINKTDHVSQLNQRKEFDLFSSKPSDDPFLISDLSSLSTSTLDNNLVKSRVKFTNRKRPSNRLTKSAIKVDQNDEFFTKQIKIEEENRELVKKEVITKNKDEDLKVTKVKDEPNKNVKNDAKGKAATKKKILFDDSDDDDYDFFKSQQSSKKSETSKQNLKESLDKKFSKLFDDSDEDDDQLFSKKSSAKEKSKEIKILNLSDEDSDELFLKK